MTRWGKDVGDAVEVLDGSNDKILKGTLWNWKNDRTCIVWVERFKGYMTFRDGITGLGRFTLKGYGE